MGMSMLQMAIRARIPIITVRTKDPLNVGKLLEHLSSVPVLTDPKYQAHGVPVLPPSSVTYIVGDPPVSIDLTRTYLYAVQQQAVLIVVNWEEPHPATFDAGELTLPDSVVTEFVLTYAPEEADHYSIVAALRGCTYKEMVELARLAMSESGEFTAESVLRVRRERTVLSSGLQLVDTSQFFYTAPAELERWLSVDGVLFTANVDRVIRPRGLLFYGLPGTGKTAGAKYLAHQLRLPLYLLDVGSTMQKYVGESEKTFASALSQVEALSPCVLLMDEVEKVFAAQDDSGVSRRVLGMLLWWLQEHQSQVLTIMTTNDADALPPELVRPGRVDQRLLFPPLNEGDGLLFAEFLRRSLTNVEEIDPMTVNAVVHKLYCAEPRLTQAELTQAVIGCVKTQLAAKLKE